MDWGILDILKKAEFNTLMLSFAIMGWILYYYVTMNTYILGAAILSSAYCIIRFVVYIYQYCSVRCKNRRLEARKKKEKEEKYTERKNARNIEISRMFEGLSKENKNYLAFILLKGKQDQFGNNIFHFNKYSDDLKYIHQAINVSRIFRTSWGSGNDCIWIKDYTNNVTATIDPFLYELIKEYIEKNELELKTKQ